MGWLSVNVFGTWPCSIEHHVPSPLLPCHQCWTSHRVHAFPPPKTASHQSQEWSPLTQEESRIWILDIMIPREYWARTPNTTRHLPYFFCSMPFLQAHTSLLQNKNKKYLNLTAHILAWNLPAKVFQNRDAEIEISLLRTHVDQSWPFWMPAGRDSIREWRKLNHWLIFSR